MRLAGACRAGIDSDVKLWAPTAAEPKELGRQAERVMAENRQQQVPHSPESDPARTLVVTQTSTPPCGWKTTSTSCNTCSRGPDSKRCAASALPA